MALPLTSSTAGGAFCPPARPDQKRAGVVIARIVQNATVAAVARQTHQNASIVFSSFLFRWEL